MSAGNSYLTVTHQHLEGPSHGGHLEIRVHIIEICHPSPLSEYLSELQRECLQNIKYRHLSCHVMW